MIDITLSENVDFAQLGEMWRDLEPRADGSFFQSWAWVGCLAEERYPDAVLLQASARGVPVLLGLFNRRRRRLHRSVLLLHESGVPGNDAVFIEHNGFLCARDCPETLIEECLNRVLQQRCGAAPTSRIVLSGVDHRYAKLATRSGYRVLRQASVADPFVDLHGLRQQGVDFLGQLSRNTRYQLQRSVRHYRARGALSIRRAGSVAEACDFLDRLAVLHQIYWLGRRRPGAFANRQFTRFHRCLIERAHPSGAIDLLQIAAGEEVVGYLYNFRHRGDVYAYQSGFNYTAADPHQKPGLTCHHLAIEHYLAEGADRYDFLAGADRYKTSLANAAGELHWLELRAARSAFPVRRVSDGRGGLARLARRSG